MQINSDLVGLKLKEYTTEVDWRQTTNYAAAVRDLNPRYFDDEQPAGLVAQPMFAAAVSWPVISNITAYIDLGGAVAGVLHTMVHYTEYLHFHRPIKPGDRLSATGEIAGIFPRRNGTHVIFRFPFTDAHGEPVFTEYLGGMLRGVECADSGRGGDSLPEVPPPGEISSAVWEVTEHIAPEAPYIYDGCTDIVFAIHTSPAFARSVGLPGIILQGTCTLARTVRELINREANGEPAALKNLYCRFKAMVFPGEDIKIRLLKRIEDTEGKQLFFEVRNGRGETSVSDGYALVKDYGSGRDV